MSFTWNDTNAVVEIARDAVKKTLFDGEMAVSQTVTRKEVVLQTTPGTRPLDMVLSSGTETSRNSWTVTKRQRIKVVSDVTTVVTELRGNCAFSNGTTSVAASLSKTLSIPAYGPVYKSTSWDSEKGLLVGYVIYADAASVTMDFPECNGTTTTYSGRRKDEAGFWVTTRTDTIYSTTITEV